MSKRIAKNTHWLPKTGSYTIRLNRRGNIGDTLPSGSVEQTFDDLKERALRAQEEIRAIDKALPALRGSDKKAVLVKRKFQLQAELNNLRFEKMMEYLPRYSEAFLAAARLLLHDDVIKKIDEVVVKKVGFPPRYWQRFLADNGYGRIDMTTYEQKESTC